MKKVLSFDIDNTLNEPKMPIGDEIAQLLAQLSHHFLIAPISGQKFEQFLIQIIDRLPDSAKKENFDLFVAQGTQYYKFRGGEWRQVYNFALKDDEVAQISSALEKAAHELNYWEEDHLAPGDQIIENRGSMVAFSALGQKAGVDDKRAWDPTVEKREKIVELAKKYAPEFDFEVGGTTTINAFVPGQNKEFGMTHLMAELHVSRDDILYFGDMTQPGGNDFPVLNMGVETITVRDWRETANVLRGILANI